MKSFQKKIKKFLKERNWDILRPSDISKSIIIEAAELLEIFQWSNMELKDFKKDKERMEKVKKELADVVIYCFDMASLLDLDMEKIVEDKLDIVAKKYPKKLFNKNTRTGDPGMEEAYWKVKKEWRGKED